MAKNEFDCTALTPEQRDARLALDVERLLRFGRKHKLIKDLDVLVARNTLLDLLALSAPSEAKPPKENPETPAALLDEMVELAAQKDVPLFLTQNANHSLETGDVLTDIFILKTTMERVQRFI